MSQLNKSIQRAEEIFNATGILSRSIEREPNSSEREELWDISRIFIKRIYELDLVDEKMSKEEKDEYNKLAHYCVVMLHWNDIYDPPHYKQKAPSGRFRRDTLALALCLFTRISRDYKEYLKLKRGWIYPHVFESFLMWVSTQMKFQNVDNMFQFFTDEIVESWTNGKHETFASFAKELNTMEARYEKWNWYDEAENTDPTKIVFTRLFNIIRSTDVPYKFALNYISFSEDFGGMDFHSNDREMNQSFLKKKIELCTFPKYWDIGCDVAYLLNWLAWADEDASQVEGEHTYNMLFNELYLGDFKAETKTPWDIVVKSRSILSDDKDKFNFYYINKLIEDDQQHPERRNMRLGEILDNIRAVTINYYSGDITKTNEFLSTILYVLQETAFADDKLHQNEYEFINLVQSHWGIDTKIWSEEDLSKIESNDNSNVDLVSDEQSNDNNEADSIQDSEVEMSKYLKNYPGIFYEKNYRWDNGPYASSYPLTITPFANVFDSPSDEESKFDNDGLFRVFTQEEVNQIVKKLEDSKAMISLPFIHQILSKKFDMRGLKPPFWFDPFMIAGTDKGGLFYFEQNGFYVNHSPNDIPPTGMELYSHVDFFSDVSIVPGYDAYGEGYGIDKGVDEDILSSLRIDWYNPNSGNSGVANFFQTHGEHACTLPIIKALWDNWQPTVEQSKGAGSFILPNNWERFDSWDELLMWANYSEEESGSDSSNDVEIQTSSAQSDEFSFDDYIDTYKKEHPNEDQDEDLLRASVDFLYETVDGTDGLLEVFSRTGGYSKYANNKLKNGKFAQVRWGKSDRKEGKPPRYFVDLYLLKSKMNYKIDSLPNQALQSPHAHEFYVVRLYSQDDLWNNKELLESLIKDSLKARQKNKLITKRKNLSKKQLKLEYLKDLGL